MKVTMRNWQQTSGSRPYKSQTAASAAGSEKKKNTGILTDTSQNLNTDTESGSHPVRNQAQEQESLLKAMLGQEQESFLSSILGEEEESFLSALLGQEQEKKSLLDSLMEQSKGSSGFHISVSMPDDSVGQLASELARSESKMDVQQISSKAMRALANLKMAYALSEGKDKEKIAQMIRRMQKLTRQIQKKIKNLSKEEQLELRRKRAEERQEQEQEMEIRKEISRRKKKRRREENNYAAKELAQDRKDALQDTMDAMAASIGGASSPAGLPASAGVSGTAASAAAITVGAGAYAASMDVPVMDGASVDVVT